ncbi:MAG: DUF5074 domain-containing protein [Christiangramia sp.]|uniref:YncE family protein n=1 Tax=Christiangramia sp. TaxID=1931228 RepID=UPI0032429CFF
MKKKFLFFATLSLLLFSCSEDNSPTTPEPEAAFASGMFVLNEGNFGSSNATVSFIDADGNVDRSVFSAVNGTDLGDTAQSIAFYQDLAFIILNVSNKIEVVDRYTFEQVASIDTDLQNPRYAAIANGKLYVTNWGDGMDSEDDFVAVFDLADFALTEKIAVAEGPENILAINDKLYVAHQGGFSFNNLLSIIDSEENTVKKTLEVGDVPNSMVVANGDLYVLSGGKPSYASEETASSIAEISLESDEVSDSWNFELSVGHAGNLSTAGGNLLYTINSDVFEWSGSGALPGSSSFSLTEPASIYGFDVTGDGIFVSSPTADFTGDGTVYKYDLSGQLLDTYSVEINPNGVYFN